MDIKNIFQTDRAILVVCILIAGIFWLMNKMSQEVIWELDLPLKFKMNENFVFSEAPRHKISFTAEGTGWQLLTLARKDLDSLVIDVPAQPGNHNWNNEQLRQMIKEEKVSETISIPNVTPFRLSISIVEADTICVPVKVRKNISYQKGYQNTSELEISPDTVCIKGPARLLENSKSWYTDSLILDKVKSSKEGEISLINDNPELLELNPANITYQLDVSEYTELNKYARIRLVNVPDVDSISLFPGRALVTMRVPIDKYDKAREQDINLVVDLGNEAYDSNTAKIKIPSNLPDWMKNVEISPTTVEYYFVSKDTLNNNSELSDD